MNQNLLPELSFLILDFKKEFETINCINSIRRNVKEIDYQIIYLDNGGNEEYSLNLKKDGLVDILISKKKGLGGGYGQTDLWRYCNTTYGIFVQNDQYLGLGINKDLFEFFKDLVDKKGVSCIDLNGDQSGKGIWTDRAHFMRTDVFNSLGPFPNGGPGLDSQPWNEEYIQQKFIKEHLKIVHISPCLFSDEGKWSKRESKDFIFEHRCDTKLLKVIKQGTCLDSIYPPLNEQEKNEVLNGLWPKEGKIPIAWEKHSFKHWKD